MTFTEKKGDPGRFFTPKKQSYELPGGTKVAFAMEATEQHTTSFSDLNILVKCPGGEKPKRMPVMKVCGFTHFTYDGDSRITLHLTEYDAGSVEGWCSGESYTKTIKLCGKPD